MSHDTSNQIEEHMLSFHRLVGDVKDIGRAILLSNRSLPSATYNHATRVMATESETNNLITEVTRYYQAIKIRPCFMLYPTTRPATFADTLLKAEFDLIDEEDAMIFQGKKANFTSNPNIKITTIDESQTDAWTKILVKGYGLPEIFSDTIQQMFTKVAGDPGSKFYLAYLQDKPAGSLLFYSHDDVGTIYTVATTPEHIEKGVATALLNKATTDSLEAHSKMLYLLAGKGTNAEKLYQTLGFETKFTRRLYELHPKKQQ